MRCPCCSDANFSSTAPCPACGFAGDAGLIESIAHIDFLLAELPAWDQVPRHLRERLIQHYQERRRRAEIALGLRGPPLDAASTRQSRVQLALLGALAAAAPNWVVRGWITTATSQEIQAQSTDWARAIRERLHDAPVTADPPAATVQLERARYLLAALEHLHGAGRLVEGAYPRARALLEAGVEQAEVAAGLRAPARPAPAAPPRQPSAPEPPAAAAVPPPRPLRRPLTRDRLWETLLSERTLRALLFLGAALLFAAALSLIVWNWEAFPPWVQVALLALFTAAFYALGWYVRARMHLHGSGIALSAVASLLIPLDFYAFYLSGGLPRERWPEVWLVASLASLAAYTATALLLRAEFFGYLVGVALGSVLAAALQVAGADTRWWQAPLAGLALALALAGEGLLRTRGRWRVLAAPLWWVALAGTAAILPVGLGWGVFLRGSDPTLAAAMAIAWWLGSLTLALATWRYRFPTLGGVTAGALPIALWLAQRAAFMRWEVRPAWHALGWAMLVPLYLLAGRALARSREPAVRSYGAVVAAAGGALTLLAAGWAVTDATTAGVVYLLLAAAVVLAAWLWRRPWLLPAASLLLLGAAAAWLARWEANLAQLGLAWGLVAIVHIGAAVGLRRVPPASTGEAFAREADPGTAHRGRRQDAASAKGEYPARTRRRPWPQRYDAPLYLLGWLAAGLAVLPPLAMWDKAIVSYTLGNWAVLNGWLVVLLQGKEAPGLAALLALRRWPVTLFQWAAALLLLPWVWMLWLVRQSPDARLGLVYTAAAGGLLAVGCWLRRFRWGNGLPWHAAAHLCAGAALTTALAYYDQKWTALALLLAAAFYFAAARLMHGRWWLVPAGLALAAGWVLGLDWLGLPRDPLGLAAAALVLACLAGAALLEQLRLAPRRFLVPLYTVMQGVGAAAVLGEAALLLWRQSDTAAFLRQAAGDMRQAELLTARQTDATLLWAAGALLLLATGAGLCAWLLKSTPHGHAAAWLGLAAGALVASAYSQGRGSSAAKVALLAAAYVLAERLLRWASLRKGGAVLPLLARRAWRLFRRPLLIAGWSASILAIGLALIRNLVLLRGGEPRETWAIVGLTLVTALYALAARLFRQRRFLWFAGLVAFFPWTLLTYRGWYLWREPAAAADGLFDFPKAWIVLALVAQAVGLLLAARAGPWTPPRRGQADRCGWGTPLQVLAHLLVPWSLLWSTYDLDTALIVFGLAILFYLAAVWADRWQGPAAGQLVRGRCLYPVVALVPIWALYLLAHFVPHAAQTTRGLVVLGFTLPALFLGRWLARREPGYGWPLYLAAYSWAAIGTLLTAGDRPWLIAALLLDTLLAAISTWSFRQPPWIGPASGTLAGALVLALAEWDVPLKRYGWGLIALAGVYLLAAQALQWWAGRRAAAGARPRRGSPGGARHLPMGPGDVLPADTAGEGRPPQSAAAHAAPLPSLAPAAPSSSDAPAQDPALEVVPPPDAPAQAPTPGAWPSPHPARTHGEPPVKLPTPRSLPSLTRYAAALLVCGALLSVAGLAFSSLDSRGALVGYGAAAALYALAAVLLRGPVLLTSAAGLAAVAYGAAIRDLAIARLDQGLALWPGIVVVLLLAHLVDWRWGRRGRLSGEAQGAPPAARALIQDLLRWWALPLYAAGYGAAALAAILSLHDEGRLTLTLLGAAAVYGLATWHFRRRWWLLAALGTAQLAALAAIHWLGWADPPGSAVLAFAPVTWGTALAGLLVARRRGEGMPFQRGLPDWRAGWAAPLHLLLLCDVVIGQALVANLAWRDNGWVSLSHALLLVILTTAWRLPALGYLTAGLGLLALVQRLDWMRTDALNWPWPLALLALVYGGSAYLLRYLRLRGSGLPDRARIWEAPLRWSGWLLSGGTLLLALVQGVPVLNLAFRVTLGLPLLRPADLPRIQMVVSVLAILGLFYLAAAITDRRRWLGYAAAAMLLSAWSLQWLLVWEMREVQWYAVPAGVYLLGVGYLEWRNGRHSWARWIDWAALLLLLGSSFRQSLGERGWLYALLMGGEGLLILWLGSARRMRRFLYAGVGAVIVDVVGQLINQLASVNRWIVFGVVGLLLLGLGILVERRLSWVKELRERLEDWE